MIKDNVSFFIIILVISVSLCSYADGGETRVDMTKTSDMVTYNTALTKVFFEVSGYEKWGEGLSVTDLVEELKGTKNETRIQAAYLLGKAGEKAKGATEGLVRALKNDDYYVRTNAAWALSEIGDESKLAILGLIFALRDKKEHVRLNAAAAMYRLCPVAKDAVSQLRKLLNDKNEVVRENAKISLKRIENGCKNTGKE